MGKTDFKACYYATVMGFKKETFFLACYKYLIMPLQSQARKLPHEKDNTAVI